ALPSLETQIQPIEAAIALFELVDDAKTLQVVLEPPSLWGKLAHAGIQRILASVSEGRVPQVVGQRNGFDEIFVQPERTGHRPGDLCDLQTMREPCAKEVALVIDEDLCLVFQAPEGVSMHDAIAIALEFGAPDRSRLGMKPTPRGFGMRRVGRQSFGHAPADTVEV